MEIKIDMSKLIYHENGELTVGEQCADICFNDEFITELLTGEDAEIKERGSKLMRQLEEAIRRAFDEFRKEFGEDAKLENGDEFVTVLNNAVLIISLENGTLKTNFIGGAPFKVDMTLDIFEGSDEE